MAQVTTYKELIVWQKSIELVIEIYNLTRSFPKSEIYGLTSQLRRAAISIPSNIAEGSRRGTKRDYCHFLSIAFGSGAEVETQLEIAKKLPETDDLIYGNVSILLDSIMRMLNVMIKKLSN